MLERKDLEEGYVPYLKSDQVKAFSLEDRESLCHPHNDVLVISTYLDIQKELRGKFMEL